MDSNSTWRSYFLYGRCLLVIKMEWHVTLAHDCKLNVCFWRTWPSCLIFFPLVKKLVCNHYVYLSPHQGSFTFHGVTLTIVMDVKPLLPNCHVVIGCDIFGQKVQMYMWNATHIWLLCTTCLTIIHIKHLNHQKTVSGWTSLKTLRHG